MSTKDTVTINWKLLADVLKIADDGLGRRDSNINYPRDKVEKMLLDRDYKTVFEARRVLQGEQEPTFAPDEKEPGEVRHTTAMESDEPFDVCDAKKPALDGQRSVDPHKTIGNATA